MPYKSTSVVSDKRRSRPRRKKLRTDMPPLGGAKAKEPKAGGTYSARDLEHRPKSGKFRGKGKSRERYDTNKKKWVRDPE